VTDGDLGDTGGSDGVWVVAGDEVASAGLAAGLSVLGWPSVRLVRSDGLASAARAASRVGRVVLVADAAGEVPDPRPALSSLTDPLVVAVGGRPALPALADSVERLVAMAVVDADQPFGDLIRSLDRVLRMGVSAPPGELVATLRARERDARLFEALTPREQQVLGAMLAGASAAEIAAMEQVSLATVRSHIRSVLAKLGVSSQLAAVALAHRAARERGIVELIRQVHQF
jgi:DNA-binding CsgD family transcriptional regulator